MVQSALILITYTPGPAAVPAKYEPWLRREDNPTFNSVAGIGEYSNWKVISPQVLGWTHFDFLALAAPSDLERVWFSDELDRFRKKWVALWGYGAAGPNKASGHATLLLRSGEPIRARSRFVEIEFDPLEPGGERWQAVAALRKHWALGPALDSEPWRRPIAEFSPLGCSSIAVTFHAQPPKRSDWSARRALAECIAAPSQGG